MDREIDELMVAVGHPLEPDDDAEFVIRRHVNECPIGQGASKYPDGIAQNRLLDDVKRKP
jgi:hypothetical protein